MGGDVGLVHRSASLLHARPISVSPGVTSLPMVTCDVTADGDLITCSSGSGVGGGGAGRREGGSTRRCTENGKETGPFRDRRWPDATGISAPADNIRGQWPQSRAVRGRNPSSPRSAA